LFYFFRKASPLILLAYNPQTFPFSKQPNYTATVVFPSAWWFSGNSIVDVLTKALVILIFVNPVEAQLPKLLDHQLHL
jgi:hypothetical protein